VEPEDVRMIVAANEKERWSKMECMNVEADEMRLVDKLKPVR